MASLIFSERRAPGRRFAPRQVVLLSKRSLARLHGKAGREARFAGLFFQHRLILINDIWLGLAILGFASSAASHGRKHPRGHPGRERGGGTDEAQRPQALAQSSAHLISWFIWFSLAAFALTAMLSGNG